MTRRITGWTVAVLVGSAVWCAAGWAFIRLTGI